MTNGETHGAGRITVVLGSLAVHALVGALLLAIDRHPAPPAPHDPLTIEVVDPPPLLFAPANPVSTASSGGGAPASRVVATRASRVRPRWNPASPRSDADPRGAITFETGGDPSGGGSTGDGAGGGRGRGAGIGFGDGGAIAPGPPPPPPPPAPPPPKLSRARPARLIFPSRQRDVEDGVLFVMQVTVDSDGFVAGAHLLRGFGGRRDEVAAEQIWRFRYDPARDDDGRPIRSVVEQRFLVE